MSLDPIVMISSYPPRLCGIGTFAEEAREFIQKANPQRDVLVISHASGDEGAATLTRLRAQAERSGVDLRYEGGVHGVSLSRLIGGHVEIHGSCQFEC